MSGDVVNLRRARKHRMRAEAEKVAAANRVAHGVSARVRGLAENEERRRADLLEAHRVEPSAEA